MPIGRRQNYKCTPFTIRDYSSICTYYTLSNIHEPTSCISLFLYSITHSSRHILVYLPVYVLSFMLVLQCTVYMYIRRVNLSFSSSPTSLVDLNMTAVARVQQIFIQGQHSANLLGVEISFCALHLYISHK